MLRAPPIRVWPERETEAKAHISTGVLTGQSPGPSRGNRAACSSTRGMRRKGWEFEHVSRKWAAPCALVVAIWWPATDWDDAGTVPPRSRAGELFVCTCYHCAPGRRPAHNARSAQCITWHRRAARDAACTPRFAGYGRHSFRCAFGAGGLTLAAEKARACAASGARRTRRVPDASISPSTIASAGAAAGPTALFRPQRKRLRTRAT
jgi:hypothetical protein